MKESIIKLYKAYWKVFVIFIPLGFFFFSNQIAFCEEEAIYAAFSEYGFKHLLANFIGWEQEYNQEWWFFKIYLYMLLWGFLYMRCIKKIGFWKECMLVILFSILIEVFPGLSKVDGLTGLQGSLLYNEFFIIDISGGCFLMGIVFARYEGIRRLREMLCDFRIGIRKIISISGILLMGYARYYFLDSEMDIYLVPLLIAFWVELLDGMRPLQKIFEILGRHSTNMWLIHSFFCYYFYPFVKLTHISSNPWIDLGILVLLALGSSVLLDLFYKNLWKVMRPLVCL